MKITSVEATIHRIPITPPLFSEPITRPVVMVVVETDVGITGYGLTMSAQRPRLRRAARSAVITRRRQAQRGRRYRMAVLRYNIYDPRRGARPGRRG